MNSTATTPPAAPTPPQPRPVKSFSVASILGVDNEQDNVKYTGEVIFG